MNKRVAATIIVVVLALIGLVFIRRGVTPQSTGPLKLGVILPLSGDGVIYGQPALNAYKMAVEKINAANGINGRQIELAIEDGKCDGKAAAGAAQKLISINKVKIILGGGCSGETMAIAPIAEQSKVILFSSLSTSPTVSAAGDYVFRNAPSDFEPAIQTGQFLVKQQKTVVILAAQAEATEAFAKQFRQSYEQAGGRVLLDERFKKEEKDFRSYLTKLKATKAEGIVFIPLGSVGMGHFVKQARDMGITLPLTSSYFGDDPDFKKIAGNPPEGFTWIDFVPDKTKPTVAVFLQEYQARYQTEPPLLHYILGAYDAPSIIVGAVQQVGDDPTKIKKYLYQLKAYEGTVGSYSFDYNGDPVGMKAQIFQIKNGKPTEILQ